MGNNSLIFPYNHHYQIPFLYEPTFSVEQNTQELVIKTNVMFDFHHSVSKKQTGPIHQRGVPAAHERLPS